MDSLAGHVPITARFSTPAQRRSFALHLCHQPVSNESCVGSKGKFIPTACQNNARTLSFVRAGMHRSLQGVRVTPSRLKKSPQSFSEAR